MKGRLKKNNTGYFRFGWKWKVSLEKGVFFWFLLCGFFCGSVSSSSEEGRFSQFGAGESIWIGLNDIVKRGIVNMGMAGLFLFNPLAYHCGLHAFEIKTSSCLFPVHLSSFLVSYPTSTSHVYEHSSLASPLPRPLPPSLTLSL